ncbi:MAG: sel1 repeat family protein [Deltaproteobacteria bacterium]|jgi:hypothetical protein|nr:sel1 repeat family protein [Deltaproteobacteria bacterium]
MEKNSVNERAKELYAAGCAYFNGEGQEQDYRKALELFLQAADMEHPDAIYALGMMYDQGMGTEQDFTQAAHFYLQAAELGYPIAQNNIGKMYRSGEGVPQDAEKAFYWHLQAAKQGLASAQDNAGLNFINGCGTPVDHTQARYWFEQAVAQGYEPAVKHLQGMDAQAASAPGAGGAENSDAGNADVAPASGTAYKSPREQYGMGAILIGLALMLVGAVALIFILTKFFGAFAGIIGFAIELMILGGICWLVYKQVVIIQARVLDFYRAKNATPGLPTMFFIVVGVSGFIFIASINSVRPALPFLAIALIPLLLLILKRRGEFWKFLFLQTVMFPIIIINIILSLFFAHQRTSVSRKTNYSGTRITETTTTYEFPDEIHEGEWRLQHLHGSHGQLFYLNHDGTVCLVSHQRASSFSDGLYNITPLYNRNAPLPKWISWLY